MAFHATTESRKLVLSFDDGPDLRVTPLVLDELDRRGLKAIFFITGCRVMGERPEDIARRELLRKIAAHGHLVANHTMTHHNLCPNPSRAAEEIDGNAELIAERDRRPPVSVPRALRGLLPHAWRRRWPSAGWSTWGGTWIRRTGRPSVTRRRCSATSTQLARR